MNKTILQAGAAALLLLVWQGISWAGLWPSYLFPGPVDVARSLVRLAGQGALHGAILVTLERIAAGFGLAAVSGLLLGLGMARSRLVNAVISPIVLGLQAMPSICWFPLAILWIGLNEGSILFVTTFGALFAVASATDSAMRNIPPSYVRAAATMGARGVRLYTRVMLPAALPALLSGLRLGWSFVWRSLMAAELLFMNLGLGFLLGMGRELADVAQVMAVILVILTLGLLVDRLAFARAEQAVRRRWGLETTN